MGAGSCGLCVRGVWPVWPTPRHLPLSHLPPLSLPSSLQSSRAVTSGTALSFLGICPGGDTCSSVSISPQTPVFPRGRPRSRGFKAGTEANITGREAGRCQGLGSRVSLDRLPRGPGMCSLVSRMELLTHQPDVKSEPSVPPPSLLFR